MKKLDLFIDFLKIFLAILFGIGLGIIIAIFIVERFEKEKIYCSLENQVITCDFVGQDYKSFVFYDKNGNVQVFNE